MEQNLTIQTKITYCNEIYIHTHSQDITVISDHSALIRIIFLDYFKTTISADVPGMTERSETIFAYCSLLWYQYCKGQYSDNVLTHDKL